MEHRILTLNVQHGGGNRVDVLIREILQIAPETIVLTEFRHGVSGKKFQNGLRAMGYPYQVASDSPQGKNGVMIVSRHPIIVSDPPDIEGGGWMEDRHLIVRTEVLTIVAVYLPPNKVKIPSWERLLQTASRLKDEPTIFIGDFNTGKHWIDEAGATFIGAEYIDRLEALGYVDAWRFAHPDDREYTWHSSKGNGFRLDYLFASPAIAPQIINAEHIHATRLGKYTDHSGLLIKLLQESAYRVLPNHMEWIEITSAWNGHSDSSGPFSSHISMIREGDEFVYWDGTRIDSICVQSLLTAIESTPAEPVDPIYIVGTEEWMNMGIWTDDLPSIRVTIHLNAPELILSSSSQKPLMIPWEIEIAGSTRESFNPDISKALASLMPKGTINEERLA